MYIYIRLSMSYFLHLLVYHEYLISLYMILDICGPYLLCIKCIISSLCRPHLLRGRSVGRQRAAAAAHPGRREHSGPTAARGAGEAEAPRRAAGEHRPRGACFSLEMRRKSMKISRNRTCLAPFRGVSGLKLGPKSRFLRCFSGRGASAASAPFRGESHGGPKHTTNCSRSLENLGFRSFFIDLSWIFHRFQLMFR